MALINIEKLEITVDVQSLSDAFDKLDKILTNTNKIMATLAQITTEFEALKTAIAEERAQATASRITGVN